MYRYGPIYHEALRLEEKIERPHAALLVVERGLKEIPRYGPLWFGYFRVAEKLDVDEWLRDLRVFAGKKRRSQRKRLRSLQQRQELTGGQTQLQASTEMDSGTGEEKVQRHPSLDPPLVRTRRALSAAMNAISKELVWKVQFEAAQIEERTAALTRMELAHWRLELGGLETILDRLQGKPGAPPSSDPEISQKNPKLQEMVDTNIVIRNGSVLLPSLPSLDRFMDEKLCADDSLDSYRSCGNRISNWGDSYFVVNMALSGLDPRLNDGLHRARRALISSVLSCPLNLRWKVWLASARMELGAPDNALVAPEHSTLTCPLQTTASSAPAEASNKSNKWDEHLAGLSTLHRAKVAALQTARHLFARAYEEVPEKSKAHVLLECARLEEYAAPGNPMVVRHILRRACLDTRAEWKVFLEVVAMELRCGRWKAAADAAVAALAIHSGTGRIWAVLVQLRQVR